MAAVRIATLVARILAGAMVALALCAGASEDPRGAGASGHAAAGAAHAAGDDDHADADGGGHHDGPHAVRLPADLFDAYGISIATAGPGVLDAGVTLLGEVRTNGDGLAHLVPRFPGIVRDVRRTVGDRVAAGDVLAVIESNQSLGPYELRTLTPGVIIARHITRGEAVDRDRDAFVIADLSSVWVDLSVYQRDMNRVAVGQRVRVGGGTDLPEGEGVISYLTPTVDPPTRTLTARVVLPNPDGRWRPGLFVTGSILDTVPAAIAVPRAALQRIENREVVFVETPDGFVLRPVALGRGGVLMVEVLSGLAPGDRYVATGGFVLKAELGKGDAEHDH